MGGLEDKGRKSRGGARGTNRNVSDNTLKFAAMLLEPPHLIEAPVKTGFPQPDADGLLFLLLVTCNV